MPFVLLLSALLGCTAPGPSTPDGAPLTGRWGGAHAALTLTDSGGSIEYDCAHGGIAEAVRPTAGRFAAAGVYVREHGGPIREGERVDSLPAHHLGELRGDRLTLRVVVGADTLGPFDLQRGVDAHVFKCL